MKETVCGQQGPRKQNKYISGRPIAILIRKIERLECKKDNSFFVRDFTEVLL